MNDRRHQVLLTAKRIFVEKGFSATSVQDILDEAKISKGTFYNYFTSKNECLMAILEHGRNETISRRHELLIGQEKSNKSVLTAQISSRLQVNRDHNLLPIFEAVFYSGDRDLQHFAKKQHLAELSWLAGRLTDVYGEDARPFASDCAVLMMGMMQHMINISPTLLQKDIDPTQLVTFTMRRIDVIIFDMIEKNDRFLDDPLFVNEKAETSTSLLTRLLKFQDLLKTTAQPENKQYLQFLVNEIKSDQPRIFLIKTVTRAFREAFINTPYEQQVQELAAHLWKYIDTLEE